MITLYQVKRLEKYYNEDIIPPSIFKYALDVELEHGTKYGKLTNITNNSLYKTVGLRLLIL